MLSPTLTRMVLLGIPWRASAASPAGRNSFWSSSIVAAKKATLRRAGVVVASHHRAHRGIIYPLDAIGMLGQTLQSLAATLEHQYNEFQTVSRNTSRAAAGLLLDAVLDQVYEDFRSIIPYERIGFAILEDQRKILRAHWARTTVPRVRITPGFRALLAGSSLESIMITRIPRIINDLEAYLRAKPTSRSPRLIVEEGIRSSLT